MYRLAFDMKRDSFIATNCSKSEDLVAGVEGIQARTVSQRVIISGE